ncbi:MAG: ATP-binding cassette domain-containing protein [Elusimicrobia bacterium]|nr:ATP-binding cassette domain-containing protein [Elusimicrobiota bacterium]MBD3412556.1 ATP-binding cassette domain-containing protein [Elusimicrobiota bacterium]
MSNALEINELSFSYNSHQVLENISVSIPASRMVGILGPNGAGKTTLMHIITGILKPTSGTVRIFGKNPADAGEMIGYVPQHSVYDIRFPILVEDVVLMGLLSRKKIGRRFSPQDYDAALKALQTVAMHEFSRHQIGELSGGQQQRVLLARALVSNPQLLILDEPLTGVDICLEFEIYELLKNLKQSMTILLISHDIGAVSQHVDTIMCLNKTLFAHDDKEKVLQKLDRIYGCPVDIIAHGVPHRVLKDH